MFDYHVFEYLGTININRPYATIGLKPESKV